MKAFKALQTRQDRSKIDYYILVSFVLHDTQSDSRSKVDFRKTLTFALNV